MSGNPTPKSTVGNTIKLYLFPVLVTILASLIWRDVTEMRSDIKALLAQSNIDKTEIQNLKRDVQMLDHEVFKTPMVTASADETESYDFTTYRDKYFKPEEFYDIYKYIPKS